MGAVFARAGRPLLGVDCAGFATGTAAGSSRWQIRFEVIPLSSSLLGAKETVRLVTLGWTSLLMSTGAAFLFLKAAELVAMAAAFLAEALGMA